jgi:hypothetical protein
VLPLAPRTAYIQTSNQRIGCRRGWMDSIRKGMGRNKEIPQSVSVRPLLIRVRLYRDRRLYRNLTLLDIRTELT